MATCIYDPLNLVALYIIVSIIIIIIIIIKEKIDIAMLGVSDWRPIYQKAPAPQYQHIERKKRGVK